MKKTIGIIVGTGPGAAAGADFRPA